VILCVATTPSIDRLFEVARLVPGAIHRPERYVAVAGGKGLNVARAAAALGAEVRAVAPLGGHAGRWIAAELERQGIAVDIVEVAGETRSCLSVAVGGELTEFYEHAAPLGDGGWERLERAVAARLPAAAWLTLSGSLPAGAPPDGHARLIAAAHAAGVRVAVDTHGEPLEHALRAHPGLVKVNADEAAEVAAPGAAALRAITRGAAAVTHGADGLELCDEEGRILRARPPAVGAYPVGSGDACLAGLVSALADGADWAGAVALGVGAAAANAELPGAGRLDPQRARALAALV
jgi:1-phosphofructokinase family hexose kinase